MHNAEVLIMLYNVNVLVLLYNADVLILLYNVNVLALLRNADVLIRQNGNPLPGQTKRMRTHQFVIKSAPPSHPHHSRWVGPAALARDMCRMKRVYCCWQGCVQSCMPAGAVRVGTACGVIEKKRTL